MPDCDAANIMNEGPINNCYHPIRVHRIRNKGCVNTLDQTIIATEKIVWIQSGTRPVTYSSILQNLESTYGVSEKEILFCAIIPKDKQIIEIKKTNSSLDIPSGFLDIIRRSLCMDRASKEDFSYHLIFYNGENLGTVEEICKSSLGKK